jgi:hypothetical protein
MPAILLTAVAIAARLPSITIEQTAKGYIAKVATFDMRKQTEVDAEIQRRASALCGDQQVEWGEFSSVAKVGRNAAAEPAPVTGYSKQFSCAPVDKTSYESAPDDWKATDADLKDAIRLFNAYYSNRDGGNFAAAFAMFQPEALKDETSWSEQMAADNKKLGAGKRRVTGVTWYVNPDSAPHAGVYVAIDFVGDFPSAYFYCGYLALYRRGPGSYEITREEQNMFTHGDGNADPAQIEQMRSAMCRGQ